MLKRISLILTVVSMVSAMTATVAAATDHRAMPDGVWEMNDGADWIRFFELRGQKQVQWHSDSHKPCKGGPATSSSGYWWKDAKGDLHVKIWARCDTARIRLRPIDVGFSWELNGDLTEQGSDARWVNYLLHPDPPFIDPGCYQDTGDADLTYVGPVDTAHNIQPSPGSFDGSCPSPVALSGLALVVAFDAAEATFKCGGLNGVLINNLNASGYPGFPQNAWLCQGTS